MSQSSLVWNQPTKHFVNQYFLECYFVLYSNKFYIKVPVHLKTCRNQLWRQHYISASTWCKILFKKITIFFLNEYLKKKMLKPLDNRHHSWILTFSKRVMSILGTPRAWPHTGESADPEYVVRVHIQSLHFVL